MSIYICEKCGTIDNTAVGGYWKNCRRNQIKMCGTCNTGVWHNTFEKKHWSEYEYSVEELLELEARGDGSMLNATKYFLSIGKLPNVKIFQLKEDNSNHIQIAKDFDAMYNTNIAETINITHCLSVDDEIVSVCTLDIENGMYDKYEESYYVLCDAFTVPDKRQKGFAKALILDVIEELTKPVYITLLDDSLIPFYKKLGFEQKTDQDDKWNGDMVRVQGLYEIKDRRFDVPFPLARCSKLQHVINAIAILNKAGYNTHDMLVERTKPLNTVMIDGKIINLT